MRNSLSKKKKVSSKYKTKLKIGDEAVVIAGKSKSSRGKILAMSLKSGKVILQGVNLKKKFAQPSQEMPQGGVVEMEFPMHLTNIQYYDTKSKRPTRLRYQINKDGQKIRVAVKSGAEID